MSTQSVAAPVRTSIVVEATKERAFEVFTARMGSWWPADKHILAGELAEMEFEPRVGGRIIDRAVDGSESRWARVLAYEPPDRLVFSWDISLSWQVETDPARMQRGGGPVHRRRRERTRVELEHRGLERHGDGWEAMRDAVASPGGWGDGLRSFAAYLAG